MSVWFALTQIATLHELGFRHFQVWRGSKEQPVGLLHPNRGFGYYNAYYERNGK